MPAADTSTSRVTRSGDSPATSAVTHPPLGFPPRSVRPRPSRVGPFVACRPVPGDRDPPAGLLGGAVPGRVEPPPPPLLGEVGQVLEPVLPLAAEAVHEHDRGAVTLA